MNVRSLQKVTNERSDQTRRKLLDAGINLFGLYGYDGTTTRALAEEAGTNLAAIPYHFGGKDGLYRSVAQAVLEGLGEKMDGFLNDIAQEMDNGITSTEQAVVLAERLLIDFSEIVLQRPDADHWIRFILREQMEPTEVFEMIYDSPIRRMRTLLTRLLARISGLEPTHTRLRLTSIQLLALIYIFRVGQTSVMKEMNWQSVDAEGYAEMRSTIISNARAILQGLQSVRA